MTNTGAPTDTDPTPTAAWSRRVRHIGGFIQLAFAAFWLVRGSLSLHDGIGTAMGAAAGVVAIGVLGYAIRVTAGSPPRQTNPEAKRIERSVTIATLIELAASFVLPVLMIAVGRSDWILPSIAITIGPLLLWLDHLVHIRRYQLAGWALTIGPVVLVATLSGTALAATTGLAAGTLLLITATAGFHDLAELRPQPHPVRALTPQIP